MAEVVNQNPAPDVPPAPTPAPAPAPAPAPPVQPQAQPQLTPEQKTFLDGLLGSSKTQPPQQPQTPTPPATNPATPQEPESKSPNEIFGNAPFAQMRIQNKALHDALEKVAPALGLDMTKLDPNDPDALQKAVIDAAVKKQAETQQQDPVMAAKLYNAEQQLIEQQRQTNALLARQGFAQVQQEFKLDQKDLEAFANDLLNKGINPYERPMDLVAIYKVINIDKLIEAQVNTKLAAKLQSQEHSTSPNPLVGAPGAQGTAPISTVAGLDALLKGMSG